MVTLAKETQNCIRRYVLQSGYCDAEKMLTASYTDRMTTGMTQRIYMGAEDSS